MVGASEAISVPSTTATFLIWTPVYWQLLNPSRQHRGSRASCIGSRGFRMEEAVSLPPRAPDKAVGTAFSKQMHSFFRVTSLGCHFHAAEETTEDFAFTCLWTRMDKKQPHYKSCSCVQCHLLQTLHTYTHTHCACNNAHKTHNRFQIDPII